MLVICSAPGPQSWPIPALHIRPSCKQNLCKVSSRGTRHGSWHGRICSFEQFFRLAAYGGSGMSTAHTAQAFPTFLPSHPLTPHKWELPLPLSSQEGFSLPCSQALLPAAVRCFPLLHLLQLLLSAAAAPTPLSHHRSACSSAGRALCFTQPCNQPRWSLSCQHLVYLQHSPGTARSGMLFLLHSSPFGPTPSLCPKLSLLCVAAGLWQGGAAHHDVPAPVWSPLHLRWGDRRGHLQSQWDQPQGAGRLRESELSLF